ncbi:MAG: hypothetical protein ACHQZS_04450 [Candidatus Binatales bacterium]
MSIFKEVLGFIERPDPAAFEPLAIRVFRHQYDAIGPYRDYCRERGFGPDQVRSIDDIPAISTVAFKYAELAKLPAERVFVTSGTTIGPAERGRHCVPNLEVYRASALGHLAPMLFPDRARTETGISMLVLHPTANLMPESSLAQMLSWCVQEFGDFGDGRMLCAADRDGVGVAGARSFLCQLARTGAPVCILGTTAALARMLAEIAAADAPIRLAAGSRVMDTGGAKGQAKPLQAGELIALAERWLAISPALVINEYGMTEMCSQLYDLTAFNSRGREVAPMRTSGGRPKLGPPWLRAAAVDPVTLKRVPHGEVGLLSFFDLANVGSVSALITEDFGIVEGREVFVLGRASREARGCALGVEEFAAIENDDANADRIARRDLS